MRYSGINSSHTIFKLKLDCIPRVLPLNSTMYYFVDGFWNHRSYSLIVYASSALLVFNHVEGSLRISKYNGDKAANIQVFNTGLVARKGNEYLATSCSGVVIEDDGVALLELVPSKDELLDNQPIEQTFIGALDMISDFA